MNPFIVAGLVMTGIGLLQEAKEGEENGVKLIAGPEGKPGKPGPKGADGKTIIKEKKTAKVEKPSDG